MEKKIPNPLLTFGIWRFIIIFGCFIAWIVFTIQLVVDLIAGKNVTWAWLIGNYAQSLSIGVAIALIQWRFVITRARR